MITIHDDKRRMNDKVRVTFTMPAMDCCDGLYLVGWFGEWDESVFHMQRMADGGWSLTLELEPGCEYLYRFRSLDGTWISDPTAPATPAELGLQNSFIISTPASV